MMNPVTICGRCFSGELIEHLQTLKEEDPRISNNSLAREVCVGLAWYSGDGRPALSSAKVALRKLVGKGLLPGKLREGPPRPHQLRPSGQPLPGVERVPTRVDRVRGLHLYLLSGRDDPWHGVWNDLIIQQHPCGSAPLVGPQLRYLIGSDHGWLGALGVGPAAFVLGARDRWVGWSTPARLGHLREVVGLARFLIRREVRCSHLASKTLSLLGARVGADWQARYGVTPLLMETFVDRETHSGRCFGAANWIRIGASTGRGRLGPVTAVKSLKDIWVYELSRQARRELQQETPAPLTPRPLLSSLVQESWCETELASLDLDEVRREQRAVKILQARWAQPQAGFFGSFPTWAEAKGAYGWIEHKRAPVSLERVLEAHAETTQARMAAEAWVLLPQDTTTLNYSGLRRTQGLGPIGEPIGQGLWLHSLLACRVDGVPLGVLQAQCWARPQPCLELPEDQRGRNAKSTDEKESGRWIEGLHTAASAARRMPQTQLVVITDREGDLYELHDAVQVGPANLHILVRAQHDRNLESHQHLWDFMAAQPVGESRDVEVPRQPGQPARRATVQVRWSAVEIQAPKVGCKKGWPSLRLWAVWVYEPHPDPGAEPLDWMLLTDLPVTTAAEAWEKVQWYRVRWCIEEWHRALKSGCKVEEREFKTAEHLKRALAFDLIVAWRVLACLKLGRTLPQLPASAVYSEDELAVLQAVFPKKTAAAGC
jgi:hypothetical protein